jgi:hypothetical protein
MKESTDGSIDRLTDCGWVAKVLYRYDQVCRLFLGVVFALPTVFALYAGLTYSIILTIVHYDGTSILSLHNSNFATTTSQDVVRALKTTSSKPIIMFYLRNSMKPYSLSIRQLCTAKAIIILS